MRRRLFRVACAVFISAALCLSARAQVGRQGTLFAQPAKVRQEALMRRLFPDYYGKEFPQEALIIEEFYPIGWSKDGKFAYYTEPADEACGCYFAELSIVDTVSDKVLWSFEYSGLDEENPDKPKYKAITDLWAKNRKLFSAKLNQYGIVALARPALLTFPINHAGDQLGTDLKIEEETDQEKRLYSTVKKATLRLTSRRSGAKTVYEEAHPEYGPLTVRVLGYLKSPYEPRVAVVMIEAWRGYEGPPHVTRIKVAGASLTAGFK
jgi:hypothetical protein